MQTERSKVIFITGASRGIGRAVANEFARAGCRLILTYRKNKDLGEQAARECKDLGAQEVLLLQLDISDEASIKKASAEISKSYKKIDILINNAAILISKPLREQSFEEISSQTKTNLDGLIKLTKACLPMLSEAIINVGSNLSFLGKRNLTVYAATKFALRGFTQALAKELPDLKVYAVHPGLTATDMGNNQGIAPGRVAKIVFRAALGHYHLPSGSDVRVRYYLHGRIRRNMLKAWDLLKSIMRR